ncbi:hypothetical protein AXW83_00295 [Bosea sp. PAMC 26642]|nr:hypothetical protein AXW83_00295 [Bosea sp. PAMC 26642]
MAAFGRDRSGSTAIEFGVVGLMLVTILLATIQFSMMLLCQMRLHDTLSDVATGANTALLADKAGLRVLICDNLILVDNCAGTLLLEKAPVKTFSTGPQPIAGATFAAGTKGDAMLIRATANIVTFVPGLPALSVSGTTLFASP